MNEIDKLSHLLEHWMEHNREHAETYREWAEKAEAIGNKELSDVLQRLYRETENLNALFEEAKKITR
jgi:hypothetical protein